MRFTGKLFTRLKPNRHRLAEPDASKPDEQLLYEESVERAAALLSFNKDQYDYALDRMRRIEDKALKLFASASVIITALVLTIRFIGGELLTAELDLIAVALLLAVAGTFISLVVAWCFVFYAVTLNDLPVLTTDTATAQFFLTKPRNETLWDAAEQYHHALEAINVIHDRKAWRINISIRAMWSTAIFFVLFVLILTGNSLFKEGGMFNKSNKPDSRPYQATQTQSARNSFSAQPVERQQLSGSVTGDMSLPNRSRGIKLGVALESYKSLAEQRAKAKS